MEETERTIGRFFVDEADYEPFRPKVQPEWPPLPLMNDITDEIPEKFRPYAQWMKKVIDRPDLKIFKTVTRRTPEVCLKVICCRDNEELFRRAVRECETAELLRGRPGIVWMLDCDIDPDRKTVSLLEEMERPLNEYLSVEELYPLTVVHIGTGILDSLIQIQKAGILYIDVHPGNIYYDEKKVKIGDFGSALKLCEAEEYNELTGVESFMAPEVWRDRKYSVQSAIYSAGMVLYWILNRCTPPFLPVRTKQEAFEKRMSGEAFPVPQLIQRFPEEMKDLYRIIQKMTAFDPAERYKTFEEARHDLALIGYEFFLEEIEESHKVGFLVGAGDLEQTVPLFDSFTANNRVCDLKDELS
ncbi:MAG: protein kinase [Blautia sp.]|nr:protein kinase [Blautia sp.]